MKKRNRILLLICLFLFFGATAQESDPWEKLKNAAYQIGFCVYHIDESYCEGYTGEYERRQAARDEEDGEVYYFSMEKSWAKKRIEDFAAFHKKDPGNFLLLFDIQQGPLYEDHDAYSFLGFIIIDLKNEIEFYQIQNDADTEKCFIKSTNENALMMNTLWREFMSGRLGVFQNKIHFYTREIQTDRYDQFKNAFKKYQQSLKLF